MKAQPRALLGKGPMNHACTDADLMGTSAAMAAAGARQSEGSQYQTRNFANDSRRAVLICIKANQRLVVLGG